MFGSLPPLGSLRPFGTLPRSGTPPPRVATIRQAIHFLLSTHPDVAALAGDRVHPGGLPQSPVYPCVVQTIVGRYDEADFDGTADLSTIRLKVSAWSPRLAEAERLAMAAGEAILAAGGKVGDVAILDSHREDEFDAPENPRTGDDQHTHQVVGMYRIWLRPI